MFAIAHLIFMLLKIAILAVAYATIVLIVLYILSKTTKLKLAEKWMQSKFLTWWLTGLIFSIVLFFYAFSYWGNHGLGDSSCIPVGYGQTIYCGDGVYTYFYENPDGSSYQRHINNFSISDEYLCAEQDKNKYVVFNLETSQTTELQNKEEYEKFAIKNNLPATTDFKEFYFHYNNYWNGWRFYLLP
ncbi:MAG: hypothetical protein NT150_00645 [Bacteroidetes bacterium]|nr:hypothetical protein [Bacteroidota bacterium]